MNAPSWAASLAVPDYLRLREGRRPILVVAPHGGRRLRPIRRGDNVNDLHTAEIAWELAERLDAHAIVNHALDRNDADLNRISHLTTRAPQVLALLAAAVEAVIAAHADARGDGAQMFGNTSAGVANGDDETPLVLFVHGWNMVGPCCDLGLGLRRRAGRLTGLHPTMSRRCYETTVARIETELEARGLHSAVGRRYTASGKDNAAQLFSGRHAEHDDAVVARLGRWARQGRVDAAQLELGISLRWPGPRRERLLDGLVAALSRPVAAPEARSTERRSLESGSLNPRTTESGTGESGTVDPAFVDPRRWSLEPTKPSSGDPDLEPAFALQAVLDREGQAAMFCGVEATGPHTMTARFSVVSTDGTMMLLVGEGEWTGEAGSYDLEGFRWRTSNEDRRVEITIDAAMIGYPTHNAYLDLESGLAESELIEAEVRLWLECTDANHGRLHGTVRAGNVALEVDTVAFVDRGGRRRSAPSPRVRVVSARKAGAHLHRTSTLDGEASLRLDFERGSLGTISNPAAPTEPSELREAEILARVPVWRPLGHGQFARWTFGVVRCRYGAGSDDSIGMFESLELFGDRS